MNYVSHYFSSHSSSPYERIGNLMPDIFPKYSYTRNKFLRDFDTNVFNQSELEMWNGLEHHYTVDAIFHEMPSFIKYTQLITKQMEQNSILNGIKRKFAVSHVLYELVLDHIVMLHHHNIVDSIYKDYYSIDKNFLEGYLDKLSLEKDLTIRFETAFFSFDEPQFLYYYASKERLVRALYYVTGKIGQWELNDKIAKEIDNIIVELVDSININEIFSDFNP